MLSTNPETASIFSTGKYRSTRQGLTVQRTRAYFDLSMSSAVLTPENTSSQDIPDLFDGRIYPGDNKNPTEVKPERNSGTVEKPRTLAAYLVPELRRYCFTPEKAKEAAAKSVAVRKAKAALPPPPPPVIDQSVVLTVKRLEQIGIQIGRTINLLNDNVQPMACPHCSEVIDGPISPKDRAQLLNALDRLLERERILRGIAAPAPFRAPRQTRQSSNNTAEPL